MPPPTAGYSGKPLLAKLGIKSGWRIYIHHAPDHFQDLLGPLPDNLVVLKRPAAKLDMVHVFVQGQADLASCLGKFQKKIVPAGVIWVSWPKKSAKVPTDVTEDVIRRLALPLGLVDVKVCAVDETWSGLKLVIRKENRK